MGRKSKKQSGSIFPILIMLLAIGALVYAFFFTEAPKQNVNQNKIETKKIEKNMVPKKVVETTIPKHTQIYAPHIPFSEYKFKYTYDINVKGTLKSLDFKMYIPRDEANKHTVKISSISQKPTKYYSASTGYIAEYNFEDISNKTISISFAGVLKTRTYDLTLAKAINKNLTPETDLSPYLRPEKYIESNDRSIVEMANTIGGKSQEEIVDNIYKYVQRRLKYKIMPNIGAKEALRIGHGKCSEFAAAMVALCRAKKIPARIVAGDFMRTYNTPHAWVEVYYDKYGWVMYDATNFSNNVVYRNGKRVAVQNTSNSANITNNYMVLRRNDIENRALEYYYTKNQTGSATLSKKFEIEKIK